MFRNFRPLFWRFLLAYVGAPLLFWATLTGFTVSSSLALLALPGAALVAVAAWRLSRYPRPVRRSWLWNGPECVWGILTIPFRAGGPGFQAWGGRRGREVS